MMDITLFGHIWFTITHPWMFWSIVAAVCIAALYMGWCGLKVLADADADDYDDAHLLQRYHDSLKPKGSDDETGIGA